MLTVSTSWLHPVNSYESCLSSAHVSLAPRKALETDKDNQPKNQQRLSLQNALEQEVRPLSLLWAGSRRQAEERPSLLRPSWQLLAPGSWPANCKQASRELG